MTSFVPPGLLFGLIISALYAGLYHLWGGRNLRDLLVFMIASAAGFAIGQVIGVLLGMPLPHVGQVYIFEASVFAWLAMIGARELRIGDRGREVDGL
jgi:hypothetical protein